ncbi:hypothetical protein EV359DRAFT_69286, partial [Lentinula novae-zelandiae]
MSSSIDETFGAAYIGIVVAALLGIYKTSSVFQGVYDFTHQKDGWVLRGLVTHIYLITFRQQPAKLSIVIWSVSWLKSSSTCVPILIGRSLLQRSHQILRSVLLDVQDLEVDHACQV